MDMMELSGLGPERMREYAISLGQNGFRGDQLFSWIHQKRVFEFDDMTDLPVSFRNTLKENASILALKAVSEPEFDNNARKFLLALKDGQAIEAVEIPHRFGPSLCVSSQAGCAMGCQFCASSEGGLIRSLTAAEIVSQALFVQADLDKTGRRISRIDFMGIGEPLLNYDNVMKSIEIMRDPNGLGIGIRRFAISTCGITPGIERLAKEGLQMTLSVSLHAADARLRSRLMPINRRYPLEGVLKACDEYTQATGRRVTYEYAMIRSVNDSEEDARLLARLLRGRLCHVNLIPLNPIKGRSYRRSTPERIAGFLLELETAGIQVTMRREVGTGISAACGQLRRREMNADLRKVRKRPDKNGESG